MPNSTILYSMPSSDRPFSMSSSALPFSMPSSARPFSMSILARPFNMSTLTLLFRSTRAPLLPHVTVQVKVVVLIRSVSWCAMRPAQTSDVNCTCSSSTCPVWRRWTEKE